MKYLWLVGRNRNASLLLIDILTNRQWSSYKRGMPDRKWRMVLSLPNEHRTVHRAILAYVFCRIALLLIQRSALKFWMLVILKSHRNPRHVNLLTSAVYGETRLFWTFWPRRPFRNLTICFTFFYTRAIFVWLWQIFTAGDVCKMRFIEFSHT